jgi:valyl-tRNA synthetase
MIPFITEEIWQRVPKATSKDTPRSIMIAPYPDVDAGRADVAADREMTLLQAAIVASRTIRAENDLPRATELPLTLRAPDRAAMAVLRREQAAIERLCNARVTYEEGTSAEIPKETAVSVAEGITVLMPLEGIVDLDKEKERLDRELKKVAKDLDAAEKKLANRGFMDRAPAEVVSETRDRHRALVEKREQLEAALGRL